jgi:UDP-N-acetylglucosamine acyltransferase
MAKRIHSTAIVDSGAELADDVEIQPYAIIGPHVHIDAGTIVGPHTLIDGRTVIGKNNHLFSGGQIGILSQDLKHKKGLVGRLEMGDNNVIREYVTISASTMSTFDDEHRCTTIGDSCLIMAYSHIAHDCHIGDAVIMANNASLCGHVSVDSRATLGGFCGIHQECAIGTVAFIGGMARVVKDVPPYMIVEGHPARCCGPNTVGLRRSGFDAEARSRIKAMYKIMFRSDLNTTQALHEIEATIKESEERNEFLDFFRRTLRGVIK